MHAWLDAQARRILPLTIVLCVAAGNLAAQTANPAPAQPVAAATQAIAIVSLDSLTPGGGATVTGALQVNGTRALIAASGTVNAGTTNTDVDLPRRGTLRICASTTVKLAADTTVPASGDLPGLLMALDHGAIEASFTTGHNADTVLTPDFRILIGGPAASHIKIRLGQNGDTCVDNPGNNAPYVIVSSVFDGSLYRVQPGQRAMFQHGSLHEVVDQEKEPCGCPPTPAETTGNEFPLAQSAGLAPLPPPAPEQKSIKPAVVAPALIHNAADTAPESAPAVAATPTVPTTATPTPQPAPKKPGFFTRVGRFFKRIFGAE